ncbi:hypothetical protein ABK040_001389 [Willaertia magna]
MVFHLVIKEIVPFENEKGMVSCIYERKHVSFNAFGSYSFPSRLNEDKWKSSSSNNALFSSSSSLNNNERIEMNRFTKDKSVILQAIHHFGISSYFIFTNVKWTNKEIVLEYSHFSLSKKEEENKTKIEIKEEKQNYTISLDCNQLEGIAYLSIAKRFFPKISYDELNETTNQWNRKVIGTTFEFCIEKINC